MKWTGLLIILAGALAGCVHSEKRTPVTQPSRDYFLGRREIEQPPADTLIWFGTLPCLQQFYPGGRLQLDDVTDHVSLWSGKVAPNSLIRVDVTGVTVGSNKAMSRRLNPDHQYELWLRP